ncbi:MAG: NB-ARC domain-containing protein [Candidatus Promineifilaceae bacterium]
MRLSRLDVDRLLSFAKLEPTHALRDAARQQNDAKLLKLLTYWEHVPSQPHKQTNWKLHYPPFQVGAQRLHFVGRQRLLEQIKSACQKRGVFLLHGMPGVGKTALASELAYQLRPLFADGVLYANLAGVRARTTNDIAALMDLLLHFVRPYGRDVSKDLTLQGRVKAFREVMVHKKALLILDNAADDETLAHLLPPSSKCCVLITSRRRDLWANNKFEVTPLDLEESLHLLQKIVGQKRLALEKNAAVKIIRLLDGLPLALQIVASGIKNAPEITFLEYFDELMLEQQRWVYLAQGNSQPNKNQSVRVSFEVSYRQLNDSQRQHFALLSVFDGDMFSSNAFASVADIKRQIVAKKAIRSLYNRSIVESAETGQFQLHALLQLYAREKAAEIQIDWLGLQYKAAKYYAKFVHATSQDNAQLESRWAHIYRSVEWLFANDYPAEAQQIVTDLTRFAPSTIGFLDDSGRWQHAVRWLERCTTIKSELSDRLLLKQGAFAWRMRDADRAQAAFQAARLAVADEPPSAEKSYYQGYLTEYTVRPQMINGDSEEALSAIESVCQELAHLNRKEADYQRGNLQVISAQIWARLLQNYTRARQEITASITLLNDQPTTALAAAYNSLVVIDRELGDRDYETKIECATKGIEVARKTNSLRWRGLIHMNKGLIEQKSANVAQAKDDFETAFDIFEHIGDSLSKAQLLQNRAVLASCQNDYESSITFLNQAREACDDERLLAYIDATQVEVELKKNDLDAAHRLLIRVEAISKKINSLELLSYLDMRRAELHLLHDEFEDANRFVSRAIHFGRNGQQEFLGQAWCIQGRVLAKLDDPAGATNAFQTALSLLKTVELYEFARTAKYAGFFQLQQSNQQVARKYLNDALLLFHKFGSMQEIKQIEAALNF